MPVEAFIDSEYISNAGDKIEIYRRFRAENLRSTMTLQVHDELNFSVYPEEKERVQQIVIEAMESAYQMKVPLRADYGWGTNWLEAH